MKNINITVVIPARYEEAVIKKTLEELESKVKIPHKVIVVNDSDKEDKTASAVKDFIKNKKYSNISLISRTDNPNPSFASALLLGFKAAKTEFVIPVMADLCDNPHDIEKMYKKILEGWDIVCGSRYIKGGKKKGGPIFQSICSHIVCLSLHYLTGIPTYDVSNAFKLYRRSILRKVLINTRSGVEISMALTLQAYFQNANIIDIPTTWIGRTLGESKFKIIERTPKYSHIYFWAIENTLRKLLDIKYKKYIGVNL